MNDITRTVPQKMRLVGRVIWKLYGLAWLVVMLPVVFYTGIAESLALGWLYFAIFGFTGGTILLVVATLIAVFHRSSGKLLKVGVAKHFDTNLKLVAYEGLISACILLVAVLLHFPVSPLCYGLASLLANSLLEGHWNDTAVRKSYRDDNTQPTTLKMLQLRHVRRRSWRTRSMVQRSLSSVQGWRA